MKAYRTVIRYEIKRLLKDRKALMSMFLLPILSGAVILFTSTLTGGSDTGAQVIYINSAEAVEEQTVDLDGTVLKICGINEDADGFVAENRLGKGCVLADLKTGRLFCNSTDAAATALVPVVKDMIDSSFREQLSASMGEPALEVTYADAAAGKDTAKMAMAVFLPYMMILLLFTNVTTYTSDSIAGEKERGCFEKTLLTPVKPVSIILGKTVSGILIGLLSTVIYGVVIALFSSLSGTESMFSGISFTAGEAALMIMCALLITYLFSTILVLCSLFAKTVKEARGYALPFMIASLGLSLYSMFRVGTVELKMYFLPVYNVCLVIQDVLNGCSSLDRIAAVTGSLAVCSLIVLGISVKAFNSERVRC